MVVLLIDKVTILLTCFISTSDQELSAGVALKGLLLAGVPPTRPPGAENTARLNTFVIVVAPTVANCVQPVFGSAPPAPVYSSNSVKPKPPPPPGGAWTQYQT